MVDKAKTPSRRTAKTDTHVCLNFMPKQKAWQIVSVWRADELDAKATAKAKELGKEPQLCVRIPAKDTSLDKLLAGMETLKYPVLNHCSMYFGKFTKPEFTQHWFKAYKENKRPVPVAVLQAKQDEGVHLKLTTDQHGHWQIQTPEARRGSTEYEAAEPNVSAGLFT